MPANLPAYVAPPKLNLPPFSSLFERLFNHRQRAFGDLERSQTAARDPLHRAHIVPGKQFPPGDAADVIDEHVMILGRPRIVPDDPLEDLEQLDRLDFEAGLL